MTALVAHPRGEPHQTLRSPSLLIAPVAALLLGLAVANSELRGTDWPAQLFRVELFRQAGLTLWNGQWYGGHYTWGYSVLFPPMAAWFGPMTVGIASTVLASFFLAAILRRSFGRVGPYAACWFAVAATVNLAVGRLTFGLGMAIGLLAVLALQRRWRVTSVLAAVATPLASPVAGAFLGLAIAAYFLDQCLRRHAGKPARVALPAILTTAAITPILVTAVLFPDPGSFPFRGGHFLGVVGSSIGLVIFLPRQARVLRIAAALLALTAVPAYLIANPLGGNLARLSIFFVAPILMAALWNRRRWLVLLAALPLSMWVVVPGAAADVARSLDDPSADAAYHLPITSFVKVAGGEIGRIEIPFTKGHWETAYIAPEIPLARGWERQIDRDRNPLFYEETLSAADYHAWILDNAVRWVALPNVDLDHSAGAEAALLETDLPWLDLRLTTDDWRLWEVADAQPLVDEPARLIADTADGITIEVPEAMSVIVRSRYTPYWSVSAGSACVEESDTGLTRVVAREPGVITLQPEFSLQPLLDRGGSSCSEVSS